MTIFSTLASMMMPETQFKKYTELILGLLILVSMITPLLQLFGVKHTPFSDDNLSQYVSSVAEDADFDLMEIQKLHKTTEREVLAILGDLQKGGA
ncbi:MAG: stage III sporulation protein AF [Bacillota bacterium]